MIACQTTNFTTLIGVPDSSILSLLHSPTSSPQPAMYPPLLSDLAIRALVANLRAVANTKEDKILLPDELNIKVLQHLRNQSYISPFSLSCFLIPRILAINLTGCVQVDDDCVHIITTVCPHMQTIILNKCPMVTDKGVREMIDCCLSLKTLHLSKCVQVTDFAFYDLFICSIFEETNSLTEVCDNLHF